MPRYPQTVADRPSPRDKKLSQLAALQALEGPQLQQQELASREQQQRVAQAMQMLGLQQQQQNAGAEQALRDRALTQQGEMATADRAAREGMFYGGTLPLQYTEQAGLEANRKAQQDLALKSFNEESGYRWSVQAPLGYAKQATDEAQAKAATDHYTTLNRKALADSYTQLDPMGNGPKVAGAILGADPLAQPAINAAAEDLQRYKTLLAMDPNSPAVPPEMRQQLMGQLPPATPAASQGSYQGLLPSIGNSLGSAASGLFNLPGNLLTSTDPVANLLVGPDAAERQRAMRMQGLQQLNDFVSQLVFGTNPQQLPDSPEMQVQKRAALEAMSQRLQQQ